MNTLSWGHKQPSRIQLTIQCTVQTSSSGRTVQESTFSSPNS